VLQKGRSTIPSYLPEEHELIHPSRVEITGTITCDVIYSSELILHLSIHKMQVIHELMSDDWTHRQNFLVLDDGFRAQIPSKPLRMRPNFISRKKPILTTYPYGL
jgi:hypothetical protein